MEYYGITKIVKYRNNKVVKANELIQQARHDLSLTEQKIILYAISRLNTGDSELPEMVLNISDFCKVCGMSCTNLTNIKRIFQRLSDKSFWMPLSGGVESCVRWFSILRVIPRSDKIMLKFHEDLKPYLLQLKQLYTQYNLYNVLAMNSKYGIRIYELFRSYLNLGKKVISMPELKRLLSAENYTRFNDFRRFVLNPAVEEINELTDIYIIWDGITGYNGAIEALEIHIRKKTANELNKAKLRCDYLLGVFESA